MHPQNLYLKPTETEEAEIRGLLRPTEADLRFYVACFSFSSALETVGKSPGSSPHVHRVHAPFKVLTQL
jgi:hypothetical protein